LPPEKLFTDCVRVLHGDSHDGLARFLQGSYRRVLAAIRSGLEAEIREEPVRAIVVGPGHALAIHGNNSLTDLSRRFREKLLKPSSEIRNSWRGYDRHFVASINR